MDSKMDLAKEVISAAEALELSKDKEVKVIDLLIKWYNKGFLTAENMSTWTKINGEFPKVKDE
jgi:hypothetical protein